MKIDYYCFVADSLDCVINEEKRLKDTHIFKNLDFDMQVAKKLKKFAIYDKETEEFYDENNNIISLRGKCVFPRCIIPDMNLLFDKLELEGANLIIDKLRTQKIYKWPNYIQPVYRDVEVTSYGEFLRNFEEYKTRLGNVFFKTKHKNIHCEVTGVANLQGLNFKSIESEEDINEGQEQNSFFSEPCYIVFTDKIKGFNDHRFLFLDKETEVFVTKKLNIVHDETYKNIPVEYRSFVVNGKFVVSRSWVQNKKVPKEVENLVQKTIESLSQEMPKTFVLDVLEFEEDGIRKYDICEFNPITCSGYEEGSSIFLLEENFNIETMGYSKGEVEFEK